MDYADICDIVQMYKLNRDKAREILYWIFPNIFYSCMEKKWILLESQEMFSEEDLIWETFMDVDRLLSHLADNDMRKPKYYKNEIIWCYDSILTCSHMKWYVYGRIWRVVQNCATEKYHFKVPFNKQGTASMISYVSENKDPEREQQDLWICTINTKASYEDWDLPKQSYYWAPFTSFWYDNELEKEYHMWIIANVVNWFTYQQKIIFTKRFISLMPAELIAKEIGISKKKVLQMLNAIKVKIKKKVTDEKTNTWAAT